MDETAAAFPLITITVYVDDVSLESCGSSQTVEENVVGAGRMFTQAMERVGMEFSPSKNACIASVTHLADAITQRLPNLAIKVARAAKSLGAALCNGKVRNAKLMQKRLKAFKVRKHRFQKLRRIIGARRHAAVLRSGGTAALVHGQANTGVSDSFLLAQRRAVAAASVAGGTGDLDLTL
eukprot:9224940-Karenia_brevis.AAC.1